MLCLNVVEFILDNGSDYMWMTFLFFFTFSTWMVSVKSPGTLLGFICLFRKNLIILLFAGSVLFDMKRAILSLPCRMKDTFPGEEINQE